MYSWKSIRIACSILLLLPIVHLAYLMSRSTMETMDNSTDTWAREVSAYAAADMKTSTPKNSIVVVGGQRVKLWRDLEGALAPRPVLMRGLGDAIIEDIIHNYSQLIAYHQPDTVVLLPGDSEFHFRDNKSPQQLVQSIRTLVEMDEDLSMTRRFYVFTPVKTPLRPEDHPVIDETTTLLEAWAAKIPHLFILDSNTLLTDPEGLPRARYFRGDGARLNEHGYLRLTVMLQAQLEADPPVYRNYVPLP